MTRPVSTERLATLEQRLADHEARCEERLGEIRAAAASTLRAVEGLKSRSWGLVLALLAWALAQVWSANTVKLDHLEAAAQAHVAETTPGIDTGRHTGP